MVLRENHDINQLYSQTYQRPSQVLGIAKERPQDMQVPHHQCVKCGHTTGVPEESEEAPGQPLAENTFETTVPVQIHGLQHFYDLVEGQKAHIRFRVDIDHASWGINSISTHPLGKITVYAKCTRYGTGDHEESVVDKQYTVDLDKLKVHYDAAEVISPKELVIYIGPDHEVLYSRSSLTFNFISVGV